jgi:hypothetical protein
MYDGGNLNVLIGSNANANSYFNTGGNVGIGTSSPSQEFHLRQTSGDCNLLIDSANGASQIFFGDDESVNVGNIRYDHASNYMRFSTNSAERVRIDSSGNVKIGTASDRYSYLTASTANLQIDGGIVFEPSSGNNVEIFNYRGTNMLFGNSGAEDMRIDSNGNLLVGTTDADPSNNSANSSADNGIASLASGEFVSAAYKATANTGSVGYFNRTGTDGAVLEFRKSGTAVGSIGVDSGDNLYIGGSAASHGGLYFGTNTAAPLSAGTLTDDVMDLGTATYRFDDVYATNGTINTSDRNEKQDIEALSDAEQRVAVACKGLLRKFRWKSAVEEKGDEARIHFGIIAQDLQDAFTAEGLDAGRYAMFINSTWTDEETGEERSRMGVRYSELLAFIIAAI